MRIASAFHGGTGGSATPEEVEVGIFFFFCYISNLISQLENIILATEPFVEISSFYLFIYIYTHTHTHTHTRARARWSETWEILIKI